MIDSEAVEMWARNIERVTKKMAHDWTRAMFVGAPVPAGIDWEKWKCQTPKCCETAGISGGPSPAWPHSEHIGYSQKEGESYIECALRLAREGGYEIPMTEPTAGQPGWEERAAQWPDEPA